MTTLGELRNKFSAVHKQYNSTAFELSKKLNETKELMFPKETNCLGNRQRFWNSSTMR